MSKTKKILLIILFILVVIIFSILLYKIFFQKEEIPAIVEPEQTTSSGLPVISEGEIGSIESTGQIVVSGDKLDAQNILVAEEEIDEIAKGSFTNSEKVVSQKVKASDYSNVNDGLVYYDANNQSFYKVNGDGSISKISDNKFYSVVDVVWSPTKNQALIEYPEDEGVAYNKILYDFDQDRALTSFNKEMKNFNFSNDGEKISAKWIGDYKDYNYIVSSDINGNNFKFVEPLGDESKNVQTIWSPDSEVLATYRESIDGERQEIFFINENGKNLKSLVVDGRGFEVEWSPRGDKILYSVFNKKTDYKPTLWIANGQGDGLGGGKRYVGLNTWVDKCDFSQSQENIVYCAVPDYLPQGSSWYPELADNVPYQIYKINVSNGQKEKVADPVFDGARVSIDHIYLDQNDQKLYYTNQADDNLYSIDLEKQ